MAAGGRLAGRVAIVTGGGHGIGRAYCEGLAAEGAHRIHYVASKGGVVAFTRTLAREVGPFGITVNSIAPGATETEGAGDEDHKRLAARAQARALSRVETPADLVGTLLYLASSDSDFMTGQTLLVDGGAVMR